MPAVTTPVLYDDAPLLHTHNLQVPGGHCLHVREWGCAGGLPALLLHGGPGSGCSPMLWRMFNPARYRVIAADQRGAGRSTPRGGVQHNTTADLLADLRWLRRRLGITQWLVVGGSWGATLALAHALDEPQAVSGLLLRAPFLARPQDITQFFEQAPVGLDEAWRRFMHAVAPGAGQTLLAALYAGLHSATASTAKAMARAWWCWEQALSGSTVQAGFLNGDDLQRQVDRLRVQSHYLLHGCWLNQPPLLEHCAALPARPVLLLQGSEDLICTPQATALLHAHLPGSHLHTVVGAGHDPTHAAMRAAMVGALDGWAHCQAWS